MTTKEGNISILVPVKDEEGNIKKCLESIKWCDDIWIVDSHSTDKTKDIARLYKVNIVDFNYDGGWPKKRNWSLENIKFKYEWVFIIDADERMPTALKEEILEAVTRKDIDGYYVRWQFFFLGREMRHCWSEGWMLRLFKHRLGRYENLGMSDEGGWDNEVHENVIIESGRVGKLNNYLVHDSKKDLSFWIYKQNRFSDWNAKLRFKNYYIYNKYGLRGLFSKDFNVLRKSRKKIFLRLPFKPFLVFFYLYIWKKGFLDGKEGLYFCIFRAVHEFITNAKIYELKKLGKAQDTAK